MQCNRTLSACLCAVSWTLAMGFVPASEAQVVSSNMVYTSVTPCRIFDTRFATNGTNGQLMANVPQTFNVVGGDVTATYFTGQGGKDGGCAIPGFTSAGAKVQAVALNFAVVAPTATGVLQAWPTLLPKPTASVLNFTAAEVVLANFLILPVRQDEEGADITVESNVRTHLLADVVGYFSSVTEGGSTGLGNGALAAVTTGGENTAVGVQALGADTTGGFNVALGYNSLAANTTGGSNVAIGATALTSNTSGQSNVAVGTGALASNSSGQANTAVGTSALGQNLNGGFNAAFGSGALTRNSSGVNNTATGANALAFNSGGSGNTAVGFNALGDSDGASSNTAVGTGTLVSATGSNNTALGANSLANISAGSSNIAVGSGVGNNVVNGTLDIYIGGAGTSDESQTIRIGAVQSAAYIAGISGETSSGGVGVLVDATGKLGTTTSSARFKQDIADMREASDELLALRPVTFHYKPAYDDGTHLLQYGLIAEEVAAVDPGLVQFDKEGKPLAVRYQFVNAMLLGVVQGQHAELAAQAAEIAAQKERVATLEERLSRLEATLSPAH
jgi:hypothetical protein